MFTGQELGTNLPFFIDVFSTMKCEAAAKHKFDVPCASQLAYEERHIADFTHPQQRAAAGVALDCTLMRQTGGLRTPHLKYPEAHVAAAKVPTTLRRVHQI